VLNENGYIDIDTAHDVGIGTDGIETILNFQKKYGMELFTVYPARLDERNLFYSDDIQTHIHVLGICAVILETAMNSGILGLNIGRI